MQSMLRSLADRQPEGPGNQVRVSARTVVAGAVQNQAGQTVRLRLGLPEAYTLTAMTCLDILRRVASGEFKPGFQTPSLVYGPDYILGFDGVIPAALDDDPSIIQGR
jgi:short subunit dehydrogenase-like uncharacterized protein